MALAAAPVEGQQAPARRSIPPMERLVDSLFALMTLEEKLGQLTQLSGQSTEAGPRVRAEDEARIRAGQVGSFLGIYGAAYTRRLQRIAVDESRLKIPLLFAYDVIHGFRTIFPVPLAEAASWDPAAVERSARVAAVEATAHGLHWTFAPMVDIARDPRWGRIVEGAGEDPYLGAVMAAARVRGFQGTDLAAANTMLATAKHFAAYGGAEGGRDYNTVDLSPQTLHQTYLRPFQAAAAAGVGAVMPAFNEVNGVPMHANADLINGVLRGRWGWDGVVVSDWNGIQELIPHGVAASRPEAGALGLHAGVDVDMVSAIYLQDLPAVVRGGRVLQREVDEAVRRVLRAKYRLGLFQDPYRYSDVARERAATLTVDHQAAAREVGRKSIVLLKNQGNLLPLAKSLKTIAVIGALAVDAGSALGSWSADGRKEEAVSLLDGIRHAMPSAEVLYAKGADVEGSDTSGFAEAVRVARRAEAVILVLGERRGMSGEASNRASIDLPGMQEELAKRVQSSGKPVVVALMNGRPLAIPWLDEHIPAILETWYLGTPMGSAVADVVFGDYSPGGKLPVTFPRATGQIPLYYSHKNTGRPPSEEGNTSKYLDVPWTPLYSFGHGLSYTTFGYGAPRLSRRSMRATDTLVVQVDVTNTGQRPGEEVVQLYLRDDVGSVTRPVKELHGFRRITLQPGQRAAVTFTLRSEDLAFYDRRMNRVVEPGSFTVFVGGGSADVKEARFEVTTGTQLGDALLR
ncbi:MAG: glycoside hydrolase family 3 C-terminal domain-containing protein [Gemmatimonadota bacterium]|nr:glycoside hydrolase family 3 C-terminal domain-containing protein [Gemmatimonadota bacterium]